MRLKKVAVLGAGPGGLYAARLIKRSHPDAVVDVFEQTRPGSTFGFGVGIAAGTQRNLDDADPQSLQAVVDQAWTHEMSMKVGDHTVTLPQDNLRSIARTTLLTTLEQCAREVGVQIHYGAREDADSLSADVVIAADGVSSATRERYADDFGATVALGRSYYLWCGTDFALPRAIFVPAVSEHGVFVAHAYPYAADRSTFLVETDERSWRAAGFDVTSERTPQNETDEPSLRYLERAFSEELGGHRLIGNRTRWNRFRTVTCRQWSRGNVVLLGDAAHTAHYSIGSGTKLAMEDAIALELALREHRDVTDALAAYEAMRRPAVEHLQAIARRSSAWWEAFPSRMTLPVESLMMSYMTRAGKISIERFSSAAPELTRAALTAYGDRDAMSVPDDDLTSWVLESDVSVGGRTFGSRLVTREDFATITDVEVDLQEAWSAAGDSLLATVLHGDGAEGHVLWLHGPSGRDALLSRLDFAERIRLARHDRCVVVEGPSRYIGDLAAGLASMRTTFVALDDESDHRATSPNGDAVAAVHG